MTDKPDVDKWAAAAGRAMFNGGGPKTVSRAFLRVAEVPHD